MPPAPPTYVKGKGKAVAFFSDDEDYAADAGSPVPLAPNGRKRKLANGDANGSRSDGANGLGPSKKAKKGKKKGKRHDGEEERQRIAAELLLKRYELPFYQGRRMILDEIVKSDTVVVSAGSRDGGWA